MPTLACDFPLWVKSLPIGDTITNARAETIVAKPAFRYCPHGLR
jgi:putative SOS response-associated peptidase YedK